MAEIPIFTALGWDRDGVRDIAYVRCDCERDENGLSLVGERAFVDNDLYLVLGVKRTYLRGPIRPGEVISLLLLKIDIPQFRAHIWSEALGHEVACVRCGRRCDISHMGLRGEIVRINDKLYRVLVVAKPLPQGTIGPETPITLMVEPLANESA